MLMSIVLKIILLFKVKFGEELNIFFPSGSRMVTEQVSCRAGARTSLQECVLNTNQW